MALNNVMAIVYYRYWVLIDNKADKTVYDSTYILISWLDENT